MEEIKQNTNESVRGSSKSTDFGNHSTKLRLRKGKVMQNFTPGMRGSIESTDLGNHSSLSQGIVFLSYFSIISKMLFQYAMNCRHFLHRLSNNFHRSLGSKARQVSSRWRGLFKTVPIHRTDLRCAICRNLP